MRSPRLLTVALAVLSAWAAQCGAQAQDAPVPIGAKQTDTEKPYIYIGRVSATFGQDDYIATGTLIKPRSAVTAAHILYDVDFGWATNVYFERGLYDKARLGVNPIASKLVLTGYARKIRRNGVDSDAAFSRDMGAITFATPPAKNEHAPYIADLSTLNGSYTTKSLGYGGEVHNGSELLRCGPPSGKANAYYPVLGSYYNNDHFVIEGGMSGGPILVFNNGWYVCGVNVSGDNTGMGLHAFDTEEAAVLANLK